MLVVIVVAVVLAVTQGQNHTAASSRPTADSCVDHYADHPAAPTATPTTMVPPSVPPTPALHELVPAPLNGLPTTRAAGAAPAPGHHGGELCARLAAADGSGPASVVFETVAEFGITRFMAVYQEHDAPVVGPVRSARVYYDHWAEGLHAIFAHAGGNSDALRELWGLSNLVNIDEVATEVSLTDTGADYFFRTTDRYAPHNLYAYPAQSCGRTWRRWQSGQRGPRRGSWRTRRTLPWLSDPPAGAIDIAFSSPDYAVHYDYDRASNTYLRSMGGAPHVDAVSGAQIAPKNVALLVAPVTPDTSSDTLGSVVVASEGSGPA